MGLEDIENQAEKQRKKQIDKKGDGGKRKERELPSILTTTRANH